MDPTAVHPENSRHLEGKKGSGDFFVIGSTANDALGLLYREYAEGTRSANHTYTHTGRQSPTQMTSSPTSRSAADQHAGIKTLLFRPPYGIDHDRKRQMKWRSSIAQIHGLI